MAVPTAPTLSRRTLLGGSLAGVLALTLAACSGKGDDAGPAASGTSGTGSQTVTVVTHDSFQVPEDLVAAFEKDTGYHLQTVASGDSGELVNKLILTKDAPLGDAVFGVDNTFASRVLDEGVIDTSVSVTLPTGADQYVVGATPALVPIDFGEVSVNIDTTYFASKGLTAPATFEDLVKPDYKDLFVAINPSTSSPGLAFLLATIGHFGTAQSGGFADYWRQLVANGTRIDSGWTQAYETDFSGGGNQGAYPIVVSYSSSPAATVSPDGQSSTTASLPATAFRQVEYAGVLTGAANPAGAKAFIEWMLTKDVQESIPQNMYMYPVSPDASLGDALTRFGTLSTTPVSVPAADIAANRESWLTTWSEAVGQ